MLVLTTDTPPRTRKHVQERIATSSKFLESKKDQEEEEEERRPTGSRGTIHTHTHTQTLALCLCLSLSDSFQHIRHDGTARRKEGI